MTDPVPMRSRRVELDLTQAELARRAGVSRGLVAAVEAGRHTPAVDAALRLAQTLGTTVEALFAPSHEPAELVLGDPPAEGTSLRMGRVGERLVAAPLPDHGVAAGGWGRADAVWRGGAVQRLPGARPAELVLAGCEPALGLAAQMLPAAALLPAEASTGEALAALRAGRVHAAVVHGPPGQLPRPPVPVQRHRLATWNVVVAFSAERPGISLDQILAGNLPVIQRGSTATIQQALGRALAGRGVERLPGPRAAGHLDAARRAALTETAALTTEPAAIAFGLRSVPLEEHVVELWTATAWTGHPAHAALLELLGSRPFAARIAAIGGYDLSRVGVEV